MARGSRQRSLNFGNSGPNRAHQTAPSAARPGIDWSVFQRGEWTDGMVERWSKARGESLGRRNPRLAVQSRTAGRSSGRSSSRVYGGDDGDVTWLGGVSELDAEDGVS